MILYQVEASGLLFICKVQNLTWPQSFSHNVYSGNRGWCPHTLCTMSRVQNHPVREQATHWDEINNTKEITILLCLSFSSALLSSISFTCPQFYWHTWDSTQNKLDFCWAMHCMSLGYSFKPRPHSHVLGTAGSVMTVGLSMDAHTRKTSSMGVGCFWPIFIFVVISSTFKCIVSACRGWHVLRHTTSTSTSTEKTILTSPEVQSAATSKTWFSQSLLFSFSVKKKTKRGSVHRAGSFVHEWLDAKGLHVFPRVFFIECNK